MKYEKPEWEILRLENHDVIRTSVTVGGTVGGDPEPEEDTPYVDPTFN